MRKEIFKKLDKKTIIPTTIIIGGGLLSTLTGCDGVQTGEVNINGKAINTPPPTTIIIREETKPTATPTVTATVTVTATPTPAETKSPRPTPPCTREFVIPANWTEKPVSSEICVPHEGNRLYRSIESNQIAAFSGGDMTVNYMDHDGNRKALSLPGGSDRVNLILFLGDSYSSRTVGIEGVVTGHNWVGKYNVPDQNPANTHNWYELMKKKVEETMTESSSVSGGARLVEVVVIDGNSKIAFHNIYKR